MTIARELIPPPDPMAALACMRHLPNSLALLSQGPVGGNSRYSYVMADPVQSHCWRVADGTPDPLLNLSRESIQTESSILPNLPPFQGGWAGMVGYGYGRAIEVLPSPSRDDYTTPDLFCGLYDVVYAYDRAHQRAWLISTGSRSDRALERLEQFSSLLSEPPQAFEASAIKIKSPSVCHPLAGRPDVFSNFTRQGFEQAISRAIEYIRAGDCFQVNLAQHLASPFNSDPYLLLQALERVNPAPFAGWLDWGSGHVISASPERFLHVSDGVVETRPIKGTRPRSSDPHLDAAIAAGLLASPKDRAENIMIVDLLRNDLGKACAFGSITVPKLCNLESYPTVHHMVSEVRGKLSPNHNCLQLLRGCFPGGSVTGAPKIRSMEIITELEQNARGPYCGSFFRMGHDGNFDSNILIRSFTHSGGWLSFPVGGGIVADSIPADEYDETMHKAAGLLAALDAMKKVYPGAMDV
jgi:para-aminobenzoate synthetase component 1